MFQNTILDTIHLLEMNTAIQMIEDDEAPLITGIISRSMSSSNSSESNDSNTGNSGDIVISNTNSKESSSSQTKDDAKRKPKPLIGISSYGVQFQVIAKTRKMQTFRFTTKNRNLAALIYDRVAI